MFLNDTSAALAAHHIGSVRETTAWVMRAAAAGDHVIQA